MLSLFFHCVFSTVLQIPDADFNSANFNYNMEAKLALLFNSALQKEFNSIMGRWNAARRKRAATDGAATIQVRITKYGNCVMLFDMQRTAIIFVAYSC